MAKKKNKIFVLDTNVILHDSECLYQFDEHDIVIPIMVIEELDNFKRGRETVNRHAREFLRGIDKLFGDKPACCGVKIGEGAGKISIAVHGFVHDDIQKSFHQGKVDHQILNTAYCIAEKESFDRTILVTKDINLRMKAKAVGLKAEDYTSDRVDNIDQFYKGYRSLTMFRRQWLISFTSRHLKWKWGWILSIRHRWTMSSLFLKMVAYRSWDPTRSNQTWSARSRTGCAPA